MRRDAAHRGDVGGAGGTNDQAEGALLIPLQRGAGNPFKQTLAAFEHQVLKFARARVARFAENEDATVCVGKERSKRVAPQVWAHRDGVGAELIEDGAGVEAHRLRGIAAFGVDQNWDLIWNRLDDLTERGLTLKAKRLEEGQVGLVAADQITGDFDDAFQKGLERDAARQ